MKKYKRRWGLLLLFMLLLGKVPVEAAENTDSWRFTTVEAQEGRTLEEGFIYEEKDTKSRAVGKTEENTILYLLKDEGEWLYVESWSVRGFIPASETTFGGEEETIEETADGRVKNFVTWEEIKETAVQKGRQWSKKILLGDLQNQKEGVLDPPKEENIWTETAKENYAQELLLPLDSKCFAYTKTTVYPTQAEEVYGICEYGGTIRCGKSENDYVIGVLPKNSLVYIILEADDNYYYVESGQSRGFVSKNSLKIGEEIQERVRQEGKDSFERASTEVLPEDNPVCYYTLLSVQEEPVEIHVVEGGRG